MNTRLKLLLISVTAAALMSVAVASATARRFELSNTRFLAIWPLLSFEVEGISPISCPVTIEGSFHSRTLAKVSGQLIGYVTNATVRGGRAECNNTAALTVLSATLPWHIRYDSFTGPLPRITGIRVQLIGASFRVDPQGIAPPCLFVTTAANPFGAIVNITGRDEVANRNANTLRADETASIPLTEEILCGLAGNSHFTGTAEVFLQGSLTTRILVTLVQ